MKNHKFLLMILAIIFHQSAQAYVPADGNITVTAGPFVYRTIFDDTTTGVTSGYHGDFGLILNGDLDDKGSLEIAMFHMNKVFAREQGSLTQVEQTQVMHISMGYRRWVNPYFSGALGLYTGYPMDDTKVVHSDFAPGSEITTSARDKTEYGLDISIASQVWSNDIISVVADARYAWSLTSQPDEKANHYGFMLGVKYLFQEKYPMKKENQPEKKKEVSPPPTDGKLEKVN